MILVVNLSLYRKHPDGFVLRRLEEPHAELMAPSWPYSDDLSIKEKFFKSLIKKYHSVGMFIDKEPDTPIAWCVQYEYGHPGHLYVTEVSEERICFPSFDAYVQFYSKRWLGSSSCS